MRSTILIPLFAAFASPTLSAQTDVVRTSDGKVHRRVEVTSATLDEVKFKRRGKETALAGKDVVEVIYSDSDDTYGRAVFAMGRRDYARAANLFEEAKGKSSRDVVKAYASFQAGVALYWAATSDASLANSAADKLESWTGTNGSHRNMPAALERLGQAWLLVGDADKANAAFAKLGTLAASKNLPVSWSARAKFGQGQAYVAKKDFSNARTAFVGASATLSTVDPKADPDAADLAVSAKVGEGECYIHEGRFREAENFFSQMEGNRSNPALAAAGTCGKAQALFEKALKDKDMGTVRQAQKEFAKVSATDLSDGDASAKATYFLARTLITLGKDKEGADFNQRAQSMLDQVMVNYPNSRWAVKARALKRG